jgi:uncharacterized protein (TIGR02588 family)
MRVKKNALEWAVFGISTVVIAATVALLVRGAMTSSSERPELAVTSGPASRVAAGYLVPVVVTNEGDVTAEQARIRVALLSGTNEVEAAELLIAFVPRGSSREGSVLFRRDPACCVIVARAVAYENP